MLVSLTPTPALVNDAKPNILKTVSSLSTVDNAPILTRFELSSNLLLSFSNAFAVTMVVDNADV